MLKETNGKMIARCPACAAAGNDAKGDHLAIFPDGKFSCVANPNDKGHRKEIFKLAGSPSRIISVAAKITVNGAAVPDSMVKMDLANFPRFARKPRRPINEEEIAG